jgi:thiamine biosynthesis lipoprotein
MGTMVGIDVRDEGVDEGVIEQALSRLRSIEARFSTFRPDSEVSRYGRGEVDDAALSSELREVLELSEVVRAVSDGYFDIRGHRPDGSPDPSGLVKGWAVEQAARVLDRYRAANYAITAGGDIVARGQAAPGRPWRIGVQHPGIRDRVAAVVEVRDLAIATSGAYERGDHVIDPHTGRPPDGVLSITVVGPSLTRADAYATAAFAMGRAGIEWIASLPGYAGCAITTDDRLVWTEGFEPLRATVGLAAVSPPGRSGVSRQTQRPGLVARD